MRHGWTRHRDRVCAWCRSRGIRSLEGRVEVTIAVDPSGFADFGVVMAARVVRNGEPATVVQRVEDMLGDTHATHLRSLHKLGDQMLRNLAPAAMWRAGATGTPWSDPDHDVAADVRAVMAEHDLEAAPGRDRVKLRGRTTVRFAPTVEDVRAPTLAELDGTDLGEFLR